MGNNKGVLRPMKTPSRREEEKKASIEEGIEESKGKGEGNLGYVLKRKQGDQTFSIPGSLYDHTERQDNASSSWYTFFW